MTLSDLDAGKSQNNIKAHKEALAAKSAQNHAEKNKDKPKAVPFKGSGVRLGGYLEENEESIVENKQVEKTFTGL